MHRSLTRIHYGFMIPSDHMPCSSNTEYLWNISVAHHADPSWPYVLAGTRRSEGRSREPHGIRLWSPAAHCSQLLPYAHAVKPKRSKGKGIRNTLIPYSDILLHMCIFLLFQQLDRVRRSVNNGLSTYWIDPAAAGPREDDARTLCVYLCVHVYVRVCVIHSMTGQATDCYDVIALLHARRRINQIMK